jgi:hypothetical protein
MVDAFDTEASHAPNDARRERLQLSRKVRHPWRGSGDGSHQRSGVHRDNILVRQDEKATAA